jgi:Ran GTPase-activating protein (RanGAP) involved in mRNA processing and transport
LYDYLEQVEAKPKEVVEDVADEEKVFVKGTLCQDGRLDLCKQVIGPYGVQALLKALTADSSQAAPKVKHLLLGNNICGNELGTAVGRFIASGRSALTTWYIAGNDLTAEVIAPVCEALQYDHQVRQLWLKRNPIHAEGIPALISMLKVNDTLRVLDLTNTGLFDVGGELLFQGLIGNQLLEYLYVSSNGFTVRTCHAIAAMLHTTRLKQLGLGCNRLGDGGVEALALALQHPECPVQSLELASCGISANGAKALAEEVLMKNTQLVNLNLGYLKSTIDLGEIPNYIGSLGAIYLANALRTNSTLQSLDLVCNQINQSGIIALADILSADTNQNTTLLYLHLEQFGVPHNELSREIIRKALQRNRLRLSTEDGEDALPAIDQIINPLHLQEIQSVYRIAS